MKKLSWLATLAMLIGLGGGVYAQVYDGQPITATVTNNAFLKRNVNDTATGVYGLLNGVGSSGASITNIQREFNSLASFMGKSVNSVYNDLPSWTNNDVGASTDTLKLRSDLLTGKFNASTGHGHTGAAGDGPKITSSGLATGAAAANLGFTPVPETRTVNGHALSSNVTVTSDDISLSKIGSTTYSTLQDVQNVFHSAGWVSGGTVTSNGNGTCAVSSGTGMIRTSSSSTAPLKFLDWSAAGSVSLTDGVENYVYVYYNSGSPIVQSSTSIQPDDWQYISLARVFRNGTTLEINSTVKQTVGDHAGLMVRYNKSVMPYAREADGGAMLSATGTRNFAITAGAFWEGLTRFTTSAFDSSGADRFIYEYRNGSGGWTQQTSQAAINNTQYDNGSGSLATLSASRYGVHWVYLETDSGVTVVYGQGNYTLAQAQAAQPPSAISPRLTTHAFLIGKIIIQKSDAAFTEVDSAFNTNFTAGSPTNHNDLSNLQGGAAGEYYHMTAAQNTAATQNASASLTGLLSSTDWSTFNGKMAASGAGLVDEFSGHIVTGSNYTYVLDQSAAYAYTINSIIIATSSGTISAKLQIGGVDVTGCAAPISVSSTPTTATCTAANVVSVGNKVTLVLSSNSSAVDVTFTMKATR